MKRKVQRQQQQTSKYKSKFEAAFAESLHKKKLSLPMKASALTIKLLAPISLTLSSTILLWKRRAISRKKIDANTLLLRRQDPN